MHHRYREWDSDVMSVKETVLKKMIQFKVHQVDTVLMLDGVTNVIIGHWQNFLHEVHSPADHKRRAVEAEYSANRKRVSR